MLFGLVFAFILEAATSFGVAFRAHLSVDVLVLDRDSGAPLPDVLIEVEGAAYSPDEVIAGSAKTDSDGRATVEFVAATSDGGGVITRFFRRPKEYRALDRIAFEFRALGYESLVVPARGGGWTWSESEGYGLVRARYSLPDVKLAKLK